MSIYLDASPYGLGAWLEVDGHAQEFFSDRIHKSDLQILKVENVGSKAQQAAEALALLVAVRLWLPQFSQERITVLVRGDNIAALQMAAKMQPKSYALGVIAREIALDLASASYAIDIVQHISGVSNSVADMLSRKFQDGKKYEIPIMLREAKEVCPPPRLSEWWLTKSVND